MFLRCSFPSSFNNCVQTGTCERGDQCLEFGGETLSHLWLMYCRILTAQLGLKTGSLSYFVCCIFDNYLLPIDD